MCAVLQHLPCAGPSGCHLTRPTVPVCWVAGGALVGCGAGEGSRRSESRMRVGLPPVGGNRMRVGPYVPRGLALADPMWWPWGAVSGQGV